MKSNLKMFIVLFVASIVCICTATMQAPYHQDLALVLVFAGFIALGLSFFALEFAE